MNIRMRVVLGSHALLLLVEGAERGCIEQEDYEVL